MADFKTDFLIPNAEIVASIRKFIDRSERKFINNSEGFGLGFLWEHSLHVAAITFQLATLEGLDHLVPTMAALFHDAGKFSEGEYHPGAIPEEVHAAAAARQVLSDFRVKKQLITRVTDTITALYNEKIANNKPSALVHDADFLAKFGFMGAASLFMKNTLRGRNLELTLINTFSKELTYAGVLQENMRSDSGKILAKEKAKNSWLFYTGLLQELSQHGIARYKVIEKNISAELTGGPEIRVCLVVPSGCKKCGRNLDLKFGVDKGVKCRKLNTSYVCPGCDQVIQFSFCLPELPLPSAG